MRPAPEPLRNSVLVALLGMLILYLASRAFSQPAPESFMGMGLDGITYWSSTPFANTFLTAGAWTEFAPGQPGTRVFAWENPQFDQTTLLPRYLNSGLALRAQVFPMNSNYYNRPASWPLRSGAGVGRVLVTWTGNADIRLVGGAFVSSASNGNATGSITNGRRAYNVAGPTASLSVEIHAVNSANPPTSLRVWLPDPANPSGAALEGQLWHPQFLQRLRDMPLRFLRFMDWGATNGNPQMTWSDRRLPSHAMQAGALNRRAPADGFSGNRPTGVAWEYMVMLANEIGTDMWVCIPHLADDTYIRKLARLIRFGSDGVEPYTSPQASPVYPPLRPDLKVWVEFSNEIWSSGSSFPQGNWAEQQATALGISKARFNARQFCRAWRIFQEEFGGASRLVRVAALFTANSNYNQEFLSEIASYGATLNPPVTADIASPTTYFGNGIQDWAHQKAQQQAGGADPWFYTTQTFTEGSTTRPVTIPMTSAYWSGPEISRHLSETFAEWKRRIFSGTTLQGGGPDATGFGGGFDSGLPALVQSAMGRALPLVSYEGGPSIYTDYLDGGDARDDGITAFMEALNRAPGIAEIYRIQLNMAFSKGLRHHGIFVGPSGSWGKYGQWGQLEFMDQNPSTSPRWQELIALRNDFAGLRPAGEPLGSAPSFVTSPNLPGGQAGIPLAITITSTGGEGNRTAEIIGSNLLPGLTAQASGGNITLSGTANDGGENFLYARVRDADGDAAWRIFRLYVGGGPGVALESNFEGTSPALSLPWTPVYQIVSGWTTGGWTRGAGITPAAGDDALCWSQSMPSEESASTLAHALGASATWQITLSPGSGAAPLDLRGARISFSINRRDFHAPRRYALFTSLTGFAEGQEVVVSPRISSTGTTVEVTATLPATAALAGVTSPVTFRIVGFGGQFVGHVTRLMGFRVVLDSGNLPPQFPQNPVTLSAAHPGVAYSGSLASLAVDPGDTITWEKTSGPSWLAVAADGGLSGTPASGDLGNATFNASATDLGGASSMLTFFIPVSQTTAAPVISLPPGPYPQGVTANLTTTTPGASIRYTTNGTTPTASVGTLYTGPVTLPVGSFTLRAVAYRSGLNTSAVSSASYDISQAIPPQILAHPQNKTAQAGSTVVMEVSAEGSQPLSYQWRRNGSALAGQTAPTLVLASVTAAEAGAYDVVVSNPYGNATSAAATLEVLSGSGTGQPVLSLSKPGFNLRIPPFMQVGFLLPVENLGSAPLVWSASAANNGGSANYYFFRVHAPTTAGELDYSWREITTAGSGGTRLTMLDSNSTFTQVSSTLPWTFSFFGGNKTSVTISRFGTLHFSGYTVTGNNTSLPSASAPGDMIAVLWDDWRFDADSSVWTRGTAQEFVVTWKNVYHAGDTSRRATFQAVLFKDGRIRTQYHTSPSGGYSATVGVQNAAQSTGATASLNTPAETRSGTAITLGRRLDALHSPTTWTTNATLAPGTAGRQVLGFNPGSNPVGTKWTTYVRLTSNDPGRAEAIIPVTIEIANVPWMQAYGWLSNGNLMRIYSGDSSVSTENLTQFTTANQTYRYYISNLSLSTPWRLYGNPRVQIAGPHSADFTVVQDLPANSTSEGEFRIRFNPTGPGTRRAVVRIESSCAESPFTFAIEGPGISWLDHWRAQFNLPSTGSGALTSDPDGDGAINLLEYALGGHPLLNDAAAIAPKPEWVDGLLGLTFRQYPDPALVYRVQYSENLQSWEDIWVGTGEENRDILTTVTEPEPASNSPRKFLRLRVSR